VLDRTPTTRLSLPANADALSLATDTATVTVTLTQVVSISFQPQPPYRPPEPGLVLRNGSRLAARIDVTADANVTVATDLFGRISLPLDDVAALVFSTDSGAEAASGAAAPEPPMLRLVNGTSVAGPLRWISPTAVAVDSPVLGLVEVPRDRVRACVLAKAGAAPLHAPATAPAWTPLAAELRFMNGDLLTGRLVAVDDREATVEAPWLGARRLPKSAVERVRFSGGAVVPLGALKPAEVKTVPFFSTIRPPRWGASLTGGPLRIGRRSYLDGWGVESRTEIAYDLAGQYAFFHCDVGLDEEVGDGGSVEFSIELDGRTAWRSGPLTGAMPPLRVRLPLAGAKSLRLIADFDRDAHVLDHADWAEPLLIRLPP
jgi:hypothetical protein